MSPEDIPLYISHSKDAGDWRAKDLTVFDVTRQMLPAIWRCVANTEIVRWILYGSGQWHKRKSPSFEETFKEDLSQLYQPDGTHNNVVVPCGALLQRSQRGELLVGSLLASCKCDHTFYINRPDSVWKYQNPSGVNALLAAVEWMKETEFSKIIITGHSEVVIDSLEISALEPQACKNSGKPTRITGDVKWKTKLIKKEANAAWHWANEAFSRQAAANAAKINQRTLLGRSCDCTRPP